MWSYCRLMLVMVCCTGILLSAMGCEQEGPAERAGEQVDESMEKAGDQLEQAGEKVQDAAN